MSTRRSIDGCAPALTGTDHCQTLPLAGRRHRPAGQGGTHRRKSNSLHGVIAEPPPGKGNGMRSAMYRA
jgi:hypothetical protein